MIFYNTIQLTGTDLKQAVASAKTQEKSILLIFLNTRRSYTASEITRLTQKAGRKYPIWSNRRALTNLMQKSKDIVKTSILVMNVDTGKPEHKYELNYLKYPTQQPTQKELF